MAEDWIGIVHTTRTRYMKGYSDMTQRKRLLLAHLKKRGRYEYNCSGSELQWQLMFSKPVSSAYTDGVTLDFNNHDAYRRVQIDWRSYVGTDSMTKLQNAMNKGDEALIKVFQNKSNNLMSGIKDTFAGELYRSGEATDRTNCIHGLETFLTSSACAAGDRVAVPSAQYGLTNLSCVPGAIAGDWTSSLSTKPSATIATDWPDGNGSWEYDFNSPKLINWSSTAWGTGGSTSWEDNCWRVISQAITWLTVTGGDDAQPTLIALAPNLMQGYKNAQEVKTRITIPHKESEDLGFQGVLNQDGVGLYSDFDCPVNTGYVLNTNHITIHSLFPELFWMDGPGWDIRTLSWLWAVGFFGNVSYKPKYVGKLFNYA